LYFDLTCLVFALRLKNILHEGQVTTPTYEFKASAPHILQSIEGLFGFDSTLVD
jgi:hypothetical protein